MSDDADARLDPFDPSAPLHGRWRLVRAEAGLDFAPGVSLEFEESGRLRYGFEVGAHRQELALVYRVEGDTLHTDHPAAPHARSTRFHIGPGDILVLDFVDARAWFIREL